MNIKRKIEKWLLPSHKEDIKFLKYKLKYNNEKSTIKKFYYWKMCNKILKRNNSYIPMRTVIEDGNICFPHGIIGIFISQNAKIGKNCTIFHQVTIGSNTFENSKNCGAPIIGNNVFIGAGAKIIGGVKIGDNVRIGANCIVAEDVPNNATVVMNKPRVIIHKQQRNNEFISPNLFFLQKDKEKVKGLYEE